MNPQLTLDAERLFDSGYSCSQSVLGAMSPLFGMDEETGKKAAAAFGGGMARKKLTCGAVTGAYMTLGLMFGADKELVYSKALQFDNAFLAEFGSLNCAKILESKEENPDICKTCVTKAVKILQTIK